VASADKSDFGLPRDSSSESAAVSDEGDDFVSISWKIEIRYSCLLKQMKAQKLEVVRSS
jgi:hypothetical protein